MSGYLSLTFSRCLPTVERCGSATDSVTDSARRGTQPTLPGRLRVHPVLHPMKGIV